MKANIQDCVLDLPPAKVLRLCAASGLVIRCDGGILWVTQEGIARDDFLSAGESFCIVSAGMTLVEAVRGSTARLTLRIRHPSDRVIGDFQSRASF